MSDEEREILLNEFIESGEVASIQDFEDTVIEIDNIKQSFLAYPQNLSDVNILKALKGI